MEKVTSIEGARVPDGAPFDYIRSQVQKILSSRRFTNSGRHCRLLRYLLEATLEGRGDQLKEYVLGVEVFDRGESFDPQTDPIVRTEMSRLRAKLKDYYEGDGRNEALVVELPHRSYSLVFHANDTPVGPPAPEPLRSGISRKWIGAVAVMLAGLAGCFALVRKGVHAAQHETVNRSDTQVAVLPFVNLSADPEAEYFSDGLTEQLIDCLAEIDGLRVVSRTSVFQFKGKQQDLRTIAAQLNVEMVLEGAVRKSGNHLRITTRLVNAVDGNQLESHVYDRDLQDVFVVQEQIARTIVNALLVRQIGGREGMVIKHFTKNVQAYSLYLEGRYDAKKRSESELRNAIDCYERAIHADPNYAPAHASLADAYILLALLNEMPPREAMQRAKWAAQEAVRTGDSLSHAHSALGSVLALHDWDWQAAEKEFRRSVELDPNDSAIREAFAMRYLVPSGHLDSAQFEMQLARSLDPFSPEIVLSVGTVHQLKGDPDVAIKTFQRVLQIDPGFEPAPLALAAAYAQRSLFDKALNTLQTASAPTEDEARLAVLGHVYALSRQPEQARQVLRQMSEVRGHRYVSGFYFALVHVALGQKAEALDWLEKAADERCPLVVYLKTDPRFDSLRGEPRFSALLKRVGLIG